MFPDLAHDDEVDACSGALEMLNPAMTSWGLYEFYRQEAEKLGPSGRGRRNPPKPHGPLTQWSGSQNKTTRAELPARSDATACIDSFPPSSATRDAYAP